MTHEEKIGNMKIATAVAGIGFHFEQLDLLVSLYDLLLEKEGETDLRSMSEVIVTVRERAKAKLVQEALDKISTKVEP